MSSTDYAIGIDVGASKIYMVVMDSRGDIKASKRIKLGRHKQDRSGNTVVARIAEVLNDVQVPWTSDQPELVRAYQII